MSKHDPYDSLVPVFLETKIPKGTKQIATAIFVKNEMGYFLFTAAHVTDDLLAGKLLVPLGNSLEEIDGYIAHIDIPPEVHRVEDEIDIAYYKLSTLFARYLNINFKPLSLSYKYSENILDSLDLYICSVAGYPTSKGKKNRNNFSSEIFSFTGVPARLETYEKLDISPSSNIILHFNRKNTVKKTGEKYLPPSLRGVSGGGIFLWPNNGQKEIPEWSERKLVGIFHTYKEKEGLIIGTTLIPLLAALTLGQMKEFGGVI